MNDDAQELAKLEGLAIGLEQQGEKSAAHQVRWAVAKIERYEEALHRIVQWSRAYPLEVFPEPDLKRVHEVLTAHGMTLDAISAHAMRHAVEGVGKIAREALGEET